MSTTDSHLCGVPPDEEPPCDCPRSESPEQRLDLFVWRDDPAWWSCRSCDGRVRLLTAIESCDCWPDTAHQSGVERENMRSALRAVVGPADSGPWIDVYRAAGGGYSGLQAIARAALGEDE